ISCLFFFSSRRRHTRSKRDWSSDVCSSDLSAIQATTVAVLGLDPLLAILMQDLVNGGGDSPVAHGLGGVSVAKAPTHIASLGGPDRKSTRLNSSHVSISYAVFCLKKKKQTL